MKIIIRQMALVFLLALSTGYTGLYAEEQQPVRYSIMDSHVHYLDFVQQTDGFERLVAAMDRAGVPQAIIFGMPMVKMWTPADPIRPIYYLDTDSRAYYYSGTDFILANELLKQPPQIRQRFYPFVCGINPLDLNAADQIETVLKLYPGFWKGIGELMSRHDDLTAFTYGEPPAADHPALMRVYRLAARYNLPVLIHHNISSAWKREPIYLAELENALKQNPNTTIIWAHAGISRRVDVPTLLPELRRVLSTYSNLMIDISWVVYPDYIARSPSSLRRWAAFAEDYSDRILIGTDKVGHWNTYPAEITKYYPFLDLLTQATAQKLASGNFLALMQLQPVLNDLPN